VPTLLIALVVAACGGVHQLSQEPQPTLTEVRLSPSPENLKTRARVLEITDASRALVRIEGEAGHPIWLGAVIAIRADSRTRFYFFSSQPVDYGVSATSFTDLAMHEAIVLTFATDSYDPADRSYRAVGVGRERE
jgi:hypothetical protein